METGGTVLFLSSFVVGIGGILIGLSALTSARNGDSSGWLIIVGSVVGWAFLFSIGDALTVAQDAAKDMKRSADAAERSAEALEFLTRRQRNTTAPVQSAAVPSPTPEPEPPLPKRQSTLDKINRKS